MNKRLINKILAIVIERKPEVQTSNQYECITMVLAKDNKDITCAEKTMVKNNLRMLCVLCGLSYERLVIGVCRKK